jgi:SAM-dependent methyltransferase
MYYRGLKNNTRKVLAKLGSKIVPRGMNVYGLVLRTRGTHMAECPICGYKGLFGNFGTPPRINALCPRCKSLERHRLFYFYLLGNNGSKHTYIQEPILHFAAEETLERQFRAVYSKSYRTADLNLPSDMKINIEKIELESDSVATIICMHVLEHVDDSKALAELYRILKPNTYLLLAFPIIEGWESTYESSEILSDEMRMIHFGQLDHVRYYGRDVRERIKSHGFEIIEELTGSPEDCVRFNLMRGEKIFVCKKVLEPNLAGFEVDL